MGLMGVVFLYSKLFWNDILTPFWVDAEFFDVELL